MHTHNDVSKNLDIWHGMDPNISFYATFKVGYHISLIVLKVVFLFDDKSEYAQCFTKNVIPNIPILVKL